MKKLLISSILILIVLILSAVTVRFLPRSLSPKPPFSNSVSILRNQYLSLNGELSITIPNEYQVSTQYGVRGKKLTYVNPEERTRETTREAIFIATSTRVLLAIDSVPDPDNNNFTQTEAVNILYRTIDKVATPEGTLDITWNDFKKGYQGQNYYIYRDGTFIETMGYTVNIRQYITYYNNQAYFIEFEDYFPNEIEPESWDQIVSTITFR